eukprot:3770062-Pyramimonas_sp.AAC.1
MGPIGPPCGGYMPSSDGSDWSILRVHALSSRLIGMCPPGGGEADRAGAHAAHLGLLDAHARRQGQRQGGHGGQRGVRADVPGVWPPLRPI